MSSTLKRQSRRILCDKPGPITSPECPGTTVPRGVKFGRKTKLTPQQMGHARKLIYDGQRCEDVAALLSVDRPTLLPGPCPLAILNRSNYQTQQTDTQRRF